jgi:hypothetical protein
MTVETQTPRPDIVVHGAGIAGLWIFHQLKHMSYDVLLLEKEAIGGTQSLASQGIIHSGLKYTIAGQVNDLARAISKMPDLWRNALKGEGDVDLTAAKTEPKSQYMLIPKGFMGGIVKVVSQKALGDSVHEVPKDEWPADLKDAGFKGSVIFMNEPVLDITRVVRGLAEPYKDCIRKADGTHIDAKLHIYTAAAGNMIAATENNHNKGVETQARPLLMGMLKPAPFALNAHLIGTSDKPVATITSHVDKDGTLVWYLGGQVAERKKEADPQEVFTMTRKALNKYLPGIDTSTLEWATLPVDRIEGKAGSKGWMPDTPTIHAVDDHLYCWPTKLTFAPMLADKIMDHIAKLDLKPSGTTSDFSTLPDVDYAVPPWDHVTWTKDN